MEFYLIKSAACLVIFYACYKLFLEKESIHTFKRFYLLGSVVASFTIPLITFTRYIETKVSLSPVLTNEYVSEIANANFVVEQAPNYLSMIVWGIYGIGLLFFGVRFGKNLYRMIQKIRKNPRYKNKNLFHVLLKIPITPHTFFSYIFLNQQQFEAGDIPKEVLDHEATHARELHSVDVLLMEVLQVIFWFNPFIYLVTHSIKLNHEFLADRSVLRNGTDPTFYQQLLLAFSSNANSPQLANSINYSSIKKRFTVMKTHTSKRAIWFRSLILLPLLAVLIYSFSSKEIIEKEVAQTVTEMTTPEKMVQQNEYVTTYLQGAEKNNKKAFVLTVKANTIHLNGTPSSLQTIAQDLDAITYNWEEIDYTEAYPSILISNSSEDFIQKLNREFKKTHYSKANSGLNIISSEEVPKEEDRSFKATPEQIAQYNAIANYWNEHFEETTPNRTMPLSELKKLETIYRLMSPNQKAQAETFPACISPVKATPEQLAEYNKLAKKYNGMDPSEMRIKLKDVLRLEQLYKIMTPEQRKNAAPFPNFPPAPPAPEAPHPAKVIKGVNDSDVGIPPPPPPPPAVKVIKGVNDTEAGIPPPPPPAPAPESPLDHIISMAKKGATFYYEGNKVSSDRAIELIKKNKSLNIQTTKHRSNNPQVKISKKPIVYHPRKAASTNPNNKTNNLSLQTGNIDINGKEYFYSTKDGVTTYFDRFGKQVDENGNLITSKSKPSTTFYFNRKQISSEKANQLLSNNTSIQVTSEEHTNGGNKVILTDLNTHNPNQQTQDPLIDLTDVIAKGATFYLNDQQISTSKAQTLAKRPDAIERVSVVKGESGKPIVYLWSKVQKS